MVVFSVYSCFGVCVGVWSLGLLIIVVIELLVVGGLVSGVGCGFSCGVGLGCAFIVFRLGCLVNCTVGGYCFDFNCVVMKDFYWLCLLLLA